MATGFSGDESGGVRIGDTVADFALGPIGLCAVARAKLSGATTIIGIDAVPKRLAVAKAMSADLTVDFAKCDVVEQIMELTNGRGADVAIEAWGTRETFENALRVLGPGGALASLGVYSTDLRIPLNAFAASLGDNKIATPLCPGGKERMRRLMAVIQSGRIDPKPLVTHRFSLDQIETACEIFGHQSHGALKVAITP
jgi:threonine dehydrogenase-like Zn-dependent dehydrogenase